MKVTQKTKLTIPILAVLILAFAGLLIAQRTKDTNANLSFLDTQSWTRHESDGGELSIILPPDWTRGEPEPEFFVNSVFLAYKPDSLLPFAVANTIDDYSNSEELIEASIYGLKVASGDPDIQLIANEFETIQGNAAYSIEFNEQLHYVLFAEKGSYAFTYDESMGAVEGLLETIIYNIIVN